MRRNLLLLLVAGVLLSACSSKSRPIPRYDDFDGAVAAEFTLSPWADGSPDQSHDQRTPGQEGSDRQLFGKWFTRYAEHEQYTQHDANYQPFPVPSSISGAIQDERAYEAREAERQRVEDAQGARDAAAIKAREDAAWQEEKAKMNAASAAIDAEQKARKNEEAADDERLKLETAKRMQLNERMIAAHQACLAIYTTANDAYLANTTAQTGKALSMASTMRNKCDDQVDAALGKAQ